MTIVCNLCCGGTVIKENLKACVILSPPNHIPVVVDLGIIVVITVVRNLGSSGAVIKEDLIT